MPAVAGSGATGRGRIDMLGPCRAIGADGVEVELSAIQRRILTRLAIEAPQSTSQSGLIEAVWGDDPPSTAKASLQNQISRIRARLANEAVATDGDGYVLTLGTDRDVAVRLVTDAELALLDGDESAAFDLADEALALWRGTPLVDLDDLTELEAERRRLAELLHGAEQIRLAAALRLGRSSWAIIEGERLVAQSPLDESRWAMLIEALDSVGRRGDALGVFERARRTLADELGLEPGPILRSAEASVLRVDDSTIVGPQRRPIGQTAFIQSVIEAAATDAVLLVGEPGVGKTAVLAEVARSLRHQEVKVASTRCVPHPDVAATVLVELVDELGASLVTAADPVHTFVRAVDELAADRQVALLVDDLDHAGPTTMQALLAVSEHRNVMLIGTSGRVDISELAAASLTTLDVPILDLVSVAVLASETIGRDLDVRDPIVAWLSEMTGGNPMLLEYLANEVATAGIDGPAPGVAGLGDGAASADLRSVVAKRLAGLDGAARSALSIAAVCGVEFPLNLWTSFCGADSVRAALATGLIVPSDRSPDRDLRFRHGAIHRVLYAELTPGRREEIHHAAAERLRELHASAPAIAFHAVAAATLWPTDALEAALLAGEEATAQGAHAEAASWFAEAVRFAESVANGRAAGEAGPELDSFGESAHHTEVRAMIRYGDALRLAGDPDQEAALFAAAHRALELGDDELVSDATFAVLQLGATTESGSLHERGVELADRALAQLRDPEHMARVAAAASLTHSMSGFPQRCLDLFNQAEEASTTSASRRHVLPFAYLALGHPRFLDRRAAIAEELVLLADVADDPVARFEGLQLRYSVALQRAEGHAVRAASAAMAQLVDRVGDVGRRWSVGYQRAALAHLDGDLDGADALAAEALGVFAGVSPSRALATYSAQLLVVRLAQGRVGELAPVAEELVRDQPGTPAWHAALALCLVDLEPERAAHHAHRALEDAPDDFTWLAAHVIGARAAAAVGESATVQEYIERLSPWSGLVCWQGTCAYGPVDLPLSMLHTRAGDLKAAKRHATRAHKQARSLGAPVFADELDRWAAAH